MSRKQRYFVKQKLVGLVLMVASIVVGVMINDMTICVLTVPLGLGLIFTKDMVWMNDYYYEIEERSRRS